MKLSEIREILSSQRHALDARDGGLLREVLTELPDIASHALIVSGIRRCGKSTVLSQFVHALGKPFLFLNFDDLRLSRFSVPDYALLDQTIKEQHPDILFFDEIQSAPEWELYVRQKLDEGYQVVIAGSNASLLSQELGSRLTGRHISKELFPFSFAEYCAFSHRTRNGAALEAYLDSGGFPEYLKRGVPEILSQLLSDILYRDIAVRHGIRDVSSLERLLTTLLSNAAHLVSPSKLSPSVGLKSPSTALEYFSHLEASYLIQTVHRFSWSVKAQSLSPKKLYVTDSGLIKAGSLSFSQDRGSLLENFVFMEFRRHTRDIFYFNEQEKECDFIVSPHGSHPLCVQVTWEITGDNEGREVQGLLSALRFFDQAEGVILTFDSSDTILLEGKTIRVVPAWEFNFSSGKA